MSRFGFSLHISKYLFFFGKGCLSISNINWLEFKVIFFLLGQASRRGIDRIKVFGDSMLVMNVMETLTLVPVSGKVYSSPILS